MGQGGSGVVGEWSGFNDWGLESSPSVQGLGVGFRVTGLWSFARVGLCVSIEGCRAGSFLSSFQRLDIKNHA